MELYGEELLRRPTQTDVEKLYAFHEEKHGFPVMIDNIDRTKWPWTQCPTAYRAQFSRVIPVKVNDVKRIRYKQAHEAARKDVKRAFDVLMKKWAIVRTPARSRSLKKITHLMHTCIMLHNMIYKEKGKAISPDFYPEEQHREDDPVKSAQDRLQGSSRVATGFFNLFFNPEMAFDENLLQEDVSIVPVWVKLHGVPVTAFSEDGLSAIATKLGTSLILDSYTFNMCMQSWGRSSYARAMIKLRADVELKDNIVVAMLKIKGEGHYICKVRVEYEWKPPRYSGGSENGFKPQNEYRHVLKKPNASSNGNKKKVVKPTIEVSNANPIEVLNSIGNDVELRTNVGSTNLVNNEATSSGSSFMNVDNSSTCTTPIIDKIEKFEEILTIGQAILVDEAGNPLKKVDYPGDYDSEDAVASVDKDMDRSMAS
uniref:Uncharacterized protein n=1 Tax=Tanacetum cinerariifolium TaxID=118510 RepID=A0A699HB52_TANCI|nr:hypothetical protein [Tanacetum cinerariifolium]